MSSVSRAMASWRSGLQVLEGAHVVQAVGQLDEHHAHVGDHGQQHLADVLGLAVFAVGKLDLVDLGDALDDVGDLVAEVGVDLLAGGGRVFDGVVEEARGDGGRVHLHLRQDFGHFKRMNDVRLAGGAHLALVMLDAELPGLADKCNVFTGAIGLDLAEKSFEAAVDGSLVEDRDGRARRDAADSAVALGMSAGVGCRTVAMLHYRLQMLNTASMHDTSETSDPAVRENETRLVKGLLGKTTFGERRCGSRASDLEGFSAGFRITTWTGLTKFPLLAFMLSLLSKSAITSYF